ncbi:hypothetical protein [Flavilitoribacter nigricans]|uniref:Uncharacterized protein n=1 Tax=Flavilitoribacter nigricans (strain ATCC 23147 / DSM 23189 / NBRC 102662 / NCIMB 1420 / SS-2) TaxID=1122177 RepID=A0A2D0NGL3_FLAN2|nr:hypothetical protein [Flavilitoribacter nigricans]PHN07617.1 hypothetical protein CRP01_05815 [Flavilitoribacter nigricans DSM 23189 = NBRC 102662]
MLRKVLLLTGFPILLIVACTTEINEMAFEENSLVKDQVLRETQFWRENSHRYSIGNRIDAFELTVEEVSILLKKKATSIQFELALDQNRPKAYIYPVYDNDGEISEKEFAALVVAHPSTVSAPENRKNKKNSILPKNALSPSDALQWIHRWRKLGQNWLQNNLLFSFSIPVVSLDGAWRESSEKVVFYLGLEELESNNWTPKIVIRGIGGIEKDGGDNYYDFTRPCPTLCDTSQQKIILN